MGFNNRKELAKLKPGERYKPKTHTGPGLTKQEFAKETNINYIMERYRATGQLPMGAAPHEAVFADVSNLGSFAEIQERVHAAEDAFASLPAALRSRFANDPAQLIAFVQDDANYNEAVKLGLVPKKEDPKTQDPKIQDPKIQDPKIQDPKTTG